MMLAKLSAWPYSHLAVANSAARIGVLISKADTPPLSGFFVSAAWQALYGWAVRGHRKMRRPFDRYANPHGSALPDWRQGSGKTNRFEGNSTMTKRRILTLNPSKARARFHRACAIAALHSNSSLAVRLRRYNAAMKQARALEAQEVSHA
ncbi:hypothetical protein ACSEQ5_01190 [Pseudomonas aeruginosa]|uniref:hypothetical protein n=2 Tax=Pseudomonas TaxID=286 RepID=UPI00117B78B3|nr:hypothetical protein [Pseudomonas aeruginosa]MDC3991732.1 hypothetical protein [Pseudomonas aeruginosa]MDY1099542.1 hypothetical protein [Pseudomonas aeruginosa]MDY1359499.1 hypothetical protein [Pseudomonas aeruginosa]HCD9062701.1 hypothetical protein [Pseudomonas aeruginosa]HCF3008407.1 hypothetical protein [Pseudomonas aeruginosa]